MNKTIELIINAVVSAIVAAAMVFLFGVMPHGGTSGDDGFGATSRAPNVDLSVKSLTTVATTTINPTGVVAYETKAGIDYAYVQQSLTATSGSPVIVQPPFGSATSTIDDIKVRITGNGFGAANTFDISTTTNCTGGNSSSTPALVYAHSVGTGAQDFLSWKPGLLASSTSLLVRNTLYSTQDFGIRYDGQMPFIMKPGECLSMRIATSSPSAFASYLTGTLSLQASKP